MAGIKLRIATALVISGLSAFAMVCGVEWVRYYDARRAAAKDPARREAVALSWRSVPGVASLARAEAVAAPVQASNPAEVSKRQQALDDIVSIRPLSSMNWLLLSGMDLVGRAPLDKVFRDLTLSYVTGANEGYVKGQRVVFALSLWERLTPDLRSLTIHGLATTDLNDLDINGVRRVMSAKSEIVRRDVWSALTQTAGISEDVVKRMGIPPPTLPQTTH
jgi:hypothetical protein